MFLFQKESPSKPSVAELAGRFKGHILPMPGSNDEVLHRHNVECFIFYFASYRNSAVYVVEFQFLISFPPLCAYLQLPFRRRPPCSLKLQNQKDDNEETDVSHSVLFTSRQITRPQRQRRCPQKSEKCLLCIFIANAQLMLSEQCSRLNNLAVSASAKTLGGLFILLFVLQWSVSKQTESAFCLELQQPK